MHPTRHPLLLLLLTLLLSLLLIGCPNPDPQNPQPKNPLLQCGQSTAGAIPELVAKWWPKPGEKVNLDVIKADALLHGVILGGCAFAAFIQKYLTPAPGTAALPPEDARAARDAFEQYRAEHAGGATFRIDGKNL